MASTKSTDGIDLRLLDKLPSRSAAVAVVSSKTAATKLAINSSNKPANYADTYLVGPTIQLNHSWLSFVFQ